MKTTTLLLALILAAPMTPLSGQNGDDEDVYTSETFGGLRLREIGPALT
jgi:hypothetical protein